MCARHSSFRSAQVTQRAAAWVLTGLLAAGAAAQGRPPIRWSAAGHEEAVFALDFSPDGQLLASAGADKTVKLWSYPDAVLLRTLVVPYDINAQVTAVPDVRFTPDGAFIVVAMNDYNASTQLDSGRVHLFRVSDGALVRTFGAQPPGVAGVDCSPDGLVLAAAGLDGVVRIWRMADGVLVQTLAQHAGTAMATRFSPNGARLCAGYLDGHLVAWNPSDWSVAWDVAAHTDRIARIAFANGSALLVTASWDGTAKIVRAADGGVQHTLAVGSALYAAAFAPDHPTVATGGFDHVIRTWDVVSGALLRSFPDNIAYVSALSYSRDGARLLSGAGYPAPHIRAWDPATGTLVSTLTAHAAPLGPVAFSPDGVLIATASPLDQMVRIFGAVGGELRYAWDTGADADDVTFSPDGQLAALPGANNTVVLRRLSDGAVTQTLIGHSENVTGVAFSHDGTLLASGSYFPGSIRFWRTSDWSLVREIGSGFDTGFGPFASLTFSPDDALLAVVAEGSPLVFRVADGVRVAQPAGISSSVRFSPDGQLLVVPGGVYQNQVRIFRTNTWALAQTLPTSGNAAEFTPDGAYLFVAHLDGLRIWRTSDWTTVRMYDQELGYTGSVESVQSIAISPSGATFAYGRYDATLDVCANPLAVRPGDLNCDGVVSFADINPFVLALSDPTGYQQQFPDCNILNGDVNGDGQVNFLDINPFVALLTGS